VLLLAIAPAGFMSAAATKRFDSNAVRSSLVALVILVATTTAAAIGLTPNNNSSKVRVYVLVAFWGIGNGWKWTCDRLASARLCPPSQSGEFMGLYLFSTIVLTWLPPLVFTLLFEADISMQVGLATLDVWFVLSAASYWAMGSYTDAVTALASVSPTSFVPSSIDALPLPEAAIVQPSRTDGTTADEASMVP
jgi:MFS-type transporter involved in bile tolerance (Atg22 family)